MPAEATQSANQESTGLVRGLSAWDGVLLVIGGVIGSAIFLVPRMLPRRCPRLRCFSACGWPAECWR